MNERVYTTTELQTILQHRYDRYMQEYNKNIEEARTAFFYEAALAIADNSHSMAQAIYALAGELNITLEVKHA